MDERSIDLGRHGRGKAGPSMIVWKEVRELPLREFHHALGEWSASMKKWGDVLDSDFVGIRSIAELRPSEVGWVGVALSDVARERLCQIATCRWKRGIRQTIALEATEDLEKLLERRMRVMGVGMPGGARALLGMFYGPGALP
jgi:hypothetical protein